MELETNVEEQLKSLGKRIFELEQRVRDDRSDMIAIIGHLINIIEESDDRGEVVNSIREIRVRIATLER
jgi:hypothetical protein